MSCSASSTSDQHEPLPDGAPGSGRSPSRHGRGERILARVLITALVATQPLPAVAGNEFTDANSAQYDHGTVNLDNQQAGRTTFTINTDRTTIGWQDLQQPANNRLEFNFSNGGRSSSVLNYSESINPIHIRGQVVSNGTVGFANQYGVFIDGSAVIDVGSLVAIAGNVSRDAFQAGGPIEIPLQGRVENHGLIRADQNVALLATSVLNAGDILARNGNVLMIGGERVDLGDLAALQTDFGARKDLRADLAGGDVTNAGKIHANDAAMFGGHVVNLGEIEIEDGSLLMVGADAVYVTRFDNPVLIRLPRGSVGAGEDGSARYAIENDGRIDAGRGHVRLAAADPLGFGIRQGTGAAGGTARIAARTIELEGGEDGRVHLAGELDASDPSKKGRGGQIDVTGSLIALADAHLDASGAQAGGQIRIGGEQQGSGDLQRARAVVVDAESEIRADATRRGDGGRVIVFSDDLTSIEGGISARGGSKGGSGGFVETSGLRHFAIADAPDVSARRGRPGSWLIDPYDITITNTPVDCNDVNVACLDPAIVAILDPEFDSAGFDGILRTTDSNPGDGINPTNYVSADLIERALGIGTNITLSTQAFGVDKGTATGNITLADAISIDSTRVLAGTVSRLTLLAAGNIYINANIEVLPIGSGTSERSNLALSVDLQANDASQTAAGRSFGLDLVEGGVDLNADIRTGGGDFSASGISVRQEAGRQLLTRGGDVTIRTGTISPTRLPFTLTRKIEDPPITDGTLDPKLEILGTIDTRTSDGRVDGGAVDLQASSINVSVTQAGKDPASIVTGLLRLVGNVLTGGGKIALAGGVSAGQSVGTFAGSVDVAGTLDSGGGDVTIRANRVNPAQTNKDFVFTEVAPATDPERGQGGLIAVAGTVRTAGGALGIGNDTASSVSLDGTFDTTQATNTRENGLVQVIARDSTAVDTSNGSYGAGRIEIGLDAPTSISTAGLALRTRDLTTSDGAGVNAVDIVLSGRSSVTLFDVAQAASAQTGNPTAGQTGSGPVDTPGIGVLDVIGTRSAVFNQNTTLTADTIKLTVAANPLELSTDERADSETRVRFGGTNVGGATAADGVRLNADELDIAIGDGTTATSDLFSADLGTLASPTDLGIQRQTRGDYRGLQLRDRTGALRPARIAIRQDGDLTITRGEATAGGELDLADAFGGASIGSDGMRLSLESSDGVLTVEDAAGFNDNAGPLGPGDAGKSFVTLLGGLLLPDSPGGTNPDPETVTSPNSVVFRDGVAALGSDGTAAFSVESLEVKTPGDLTITQQIASSIASVVDLVFESGRDTDNASAAGRGTMTIAAALSLQAGGTLSLGAGSSGFGDLVFAGPGITLSADEIDLRAGSEGASRNTDPNDLSRIVGLQAQGVTLRDATGAIFGDAGSSALAFGFRQAAGIDAAVDLPTLAQFGLTDGFRVAGDVAYSVRSDQGSIDLDDGVTGTNEADRFKNAALSLLGLQSASLAAIQVSADTAFVGKRVELGGVGRFTFSSILARAFGRTGTDAAESLTLRSGVGGSGNLDFTGEAGAPVVVKAPTVELIAGDGVGGNTNSTIDVRNASFDLSGPVGADRTFAYQIDGNFQLSVLPAATQFVGGSAGLPSVLALRNDAGSMKLDDFDAAELPIGLANGPSRLVLEADSIELNQKDGNDLELTTNPNLFLRLRANALSLIASVSNTNDTESGRVRMGPRSTDTHPTTGTDADFDGESLLVEAFDREGDRVTTGNLSSVSEVSTGSGTYDLALGRGPTAITVQQDGSVEAADLADRTSVSGLLARTLNDDDEGNPIATSYAILSELSTVTVEPEKVNGSALFITGVAPSAVDGAIDFAPGTSADPGHYVLSKLTAQTPESIVVRAGTRLVAQDAISLTAAAVALPKDPVTTPFGSIRFLGSHTDGSVTRLEANTISLTAGPAIALTNPDTDRDGVRDPIPPENLPKLDLSGLDELALAGDPGTSSLRLRQNASFDTTRGGAGDFLTALAAGAAEAGPGGAEWNELEVVSLQGALRITEVDLLADESSRLLARTGSDGTIVVEMPNQAVRAAPFDDFAKGAQIESNDITFRTTDPATSLNLATDKLVLVGRANTSTTGTTTGTGSTGGNKNPGTNSPSSISAALSSVVGRLRTDMAQDDNPVLRAIVRIEQAAPFTNAQLPRPQQYASLDLTGNPVQRTSLANLDIELRTTAPATTLTLDDAIRARTTGSNLILRSAGDVAISLSGRTPGYEALPAYADLQLTSLDVHANDGAGAIHVRPFTVDGLPADLTLETAGDQSHSGNLILENTFVTTGRDIDFAGDVSQSGAPGAGLVVGTSGQVGFAGNIGTAADRLDRLWVLFDGRSGSGSDARTPAVQFGRRTDTNGDGFAETPVASNQTVYTRNDILFAASDLPTRKAMAALEDPDPSVPNDGISSVQDLGDLDILLRQPSLELGRDHPANFATVAKALGNLLFDSALGFFSTSPGEKVSVGGELTLDARNAIAAVSDVSALSFTVITNEFGLLRRDAGVTLDTHGQTHGDGGSSIVANQLDFRNAAGDDVAPTVIGRGRTPRFGLPDPFHASGAFPFLDDFAVFGIRPGNRSLTTADFQFVGAVDQLAEQVPFAYPTGPSRSDLSGAYGPVRVPTSKAEVPDPKLLPHPERLRALAVDTRPTPADVVRARLAGVAVIDDRGLATAPDRALVSEARLDARDAEQAIALYDKLFGDQGERAAHVRNVLQHALDQYLESNRAQRVIGFELRRFVKNRPSTLIEAYTTLEDLDALFRYHRRLGLSPGEFRRIQRAWLEKIQPDGIALDELAETVHPSRYVRGSDILDIFGQ